MSIDNQFNTIADKLQQLIKQQARQTKENERLRAELEECRQKELANQQKINELQHQIDILKMATVEMNEQEKKNFEKKINQYVKEIDKCIAFLSQ